MKKETAVSGIVKQKKGTRVEVVQARRQGN